jgi:hypothetical protein
MQCAGATVKIAINDAALPRRILASRPPGAATDMSCSVLALAMGVLDVSGASPRRHLFERMAERAAVELEADRLRHFGSAARRDDLATYCARERRSLLEARAPRQHACCHRNIIRDINTSSCGMHAQY